jgi:hypothetical protein
MEDRRVRNAKPVEKTEKLVGRCGHCGTGVRCGIALGRRSRRSRRFGCGCSSVVEHNLAKVGVEGSNPFARSKKTNSVSEILSPTMPRRKNIILGEALGKQRGEARPTARSGLGGRARGVPDYKQSSC